MGMYRLGDIIRMNRRALSITQEQLCDGICSVETLSRMETGKQNPGKDIYELLMERMGRIRERAYSMLSISDIKILDQMKQLEDYIKLYDYEAAEAILHDLKKNLGDSILDRQFLIRVESIINYRLNRISNNEFLKELKKAIRLTIPLYGSVSLSKWPFSINETRLLINISTAYAKKGNYHKCINILEEAYNAMLQSYMDKQQRIEHQVIIINNLSKWYGVIGQHYKAIKISKEGIKLCREYNLGNVLPVLLYNITWNIERLMDKRLLHSDHNRECIKYLKQAYYLSSAMQQPFTEQFIKKHLHKRYNIKLFN